MVTDKQVSLLRQERMKTTIQKTAAAIAGMSERTARTWEKKGALPSETKQPRTWLTRPDPFAAVWETDVVPLLEADEKGVLRATTILEELQDRYPGEYQEGQTRTLQRRMRDWRALQGPDREVYFEQEHPPGREAALDFTHMDDLGVTLGGEPFAHLLFALKLSFSGWTWVQVALSETFEALVRGLQGALWELGGVPCVVRHDNLSAATHELKKSGGRQLTARFRGVLDHYGLDSTRIRPGQPHENGVVEKGNDLIKSAVGQGLVIRGSRDFPDVGEYESFARAVVERKLNRRAEKLVVEREQLRPLPPSAVPSYTTHSAKVRRWSTIRVSGRTYSVPSRLIGQAVNLRQHPEVVEVYYGDRLIETMPRLSGERTVRIDYRHVIRSLVRKPGAFARYRYREELFPSLVFRRAYDALVRFRGERADVEYVRILRLAADPLEGPVERALEQLLALGSAFDYAAVQAIAKPEPTRVPTIRLPAPDLGVYDALLSGGAR
jgi:transposase